MSHWPPAVLLYAIGNTTRLPVPHLVYSHLHAQHVGGASLFNASPQTIIAHAETLSLLASLSPCDTLGPLPHVMFEDNYTVRVGNQTLEYRTMAPTTRPVTSSCTRRDNASRCSSTSSALAGRPSQSSRYLPLFLDGPATERCSLLIPCSSPPPDTQRSRMDGSSSFTGPKGLDHFKERKKEIIALGVFAECQDLCIFADRAQMGMVAV
ncbi:hypothetical protein DFH08DRAFT_967461 [Mycena albidolilacea]|uniref:Metallo-beta-lactamase domain-containing protein n=1 Tax=Mycena albidolilacea TaxID=1033008 RepID=A0AAD7EJX9_9AGAR|nr:hypothetical protein DFH08DRAFT_967461 [Mycena albidolilacea]